MRKIKSDYVYYALLLLLFAVSKWLYTKAENDEFKFLLTPTNFFVKVITGSTPEYHSQNGYFYENFNITIEKSCSGFNFWLLCFLMCAFYVVSYFKNYVRLYIIFFLLPVCYLLTIFVNVTRITAALFIAKTFPESRHLSWLHQAEGVFIYLSFMIAFYMILNQLFTKLNLKNAKIA